MNALDHEHSSMAMNAISHAAMMCQSTIQQVASDYSLPSVLYRPEVYQDGNQWCALYGKDIQSGVCGFGDSPREAMWDFDKNWSKKIPPLPEKQGK